MSDSKTAELSKNERIKLSDPTLGGTIAETLANPALDRFAEDDEQFLKFHGIYQQDDRDKRKVAKEYIMMVRARLTAGVVPAEQYLAFDSLADRYGNGTLRITTRQSFQWHGITKRGLGPLMKGLNDVLCTTIAACGDVNRNVLAPPTPATSELIESVHADARAVAQALLPRTAAYHEIWVNGSPLKLETAEKQAFEDPLYGRTYLPRKFKVAFAIPPVNETDVFANCMGFVAIADPANPSVLLGYNLLCGGGLAMSHGNKATFPRVADVLGFFPRERLVEVARAVVIAFRDLGDRTNRKHARLKYVLEDHGPAWFRGQVEQRAGFALEPARTAVFTRQGDRYGWHRQSDGRWFFGLYVESGRVKDAQGHGLKTALREIVGRFRPEVRLTAWQNLLLVNVPEEHRAAIDAVFTSHGVPVVNQASALRRSTMACPALPTCGLALAESERVIPAILAELEAVLAELGLSDEEIVLRMTGCPNGCARPYTAEIGLIGKSPGKYNIMLGGSEGSTRLNREFRAGVKLESIVSELRPLLVRWKAERVAGERLGDFAARVIWTEQTAATLSPAA